MAQVYNPYARVEPIGRNINFKFQIGKKDKENLFCHNSGNVI